MNRKIWLCSCSPKFPETICVVCVGELLHYAPRTVYRLAEEGKIPSRPITRRHRIFIRDTISYWIKNGETGLAA